MLNVKFAFSGDISDPYLKERIATIKDWVCSTLDLDQSVVSTRKIEPWNSVRVTFSIPQEAAQHLLQLATSGNHILRELGILSVQIDNQDVIHLTVQSENQIEEVSLTVQYQQSNAYNNQHQTQPWLQSTTAASATTETKKKRRRSKKKNISLSPSSTVQPVDVQSLSSRHPVSNSSGVEETSNNTLVLSDLSLAGDGSNHQPGGASSGSPPSPLATSIHSPIKQKDVTQSSPLLVNLLQNDLSSTQFPFTRSPSVPSTVGSVIPSRHSDIHVPHNSLVLPPLPLDPTYTVTSTATAAATSSAFSVGSVFSSTQQSLLVDNCLHEAGLPAGPLLSLSTEQGHNSSSSISQLTVNSLSPAVFPPIKAAEPATVFSTSTADEEKAHILDSMDKTIESVVKTTSEANSEGALDSREENSFPSQLYLNGSSGKRRLPPSDQQELPEEDKKEHHQSSDTSPKLPQVGATDVVSVVDNGGGSDDSQNFSDQTGETHQCDAGPDGDTKERNQGGAGVQVQRDSVMEENNDPFNAAVLKGKDTIPLQRLQLPETTNEVLDSKKQTGDEGMRSNQQEEPGEPVQVMQNIENTTTDVLKTSTEESTGSLVESVSGDQTLVERPLSDHCNDGLEVEDQVKTVDQLDRSKVTSHSSPIPSQKEEAEHQLAHQLVQCQSQWEEDLKEDKRKQEENLQSESQLSSSTLESATQVASTELKEMVAVNILEGPPNSPDGSKEMGSTRNDEVVVPTEKMVNTEIELGRVREMPTISSNNCDRKDADLSKCSPAKDECLEEEVTVPSCQDESSQQLNHFLTDEIPDSQSTKAESVSITRNHSDESEHSQLFALPAAESSLTAVDSKSTVPLGTGRESLVEQVKRAKHEGEEEEEEEEEAVPVHSSSAANNNSNAQVPNSSHESSSEIPLNSPPPTEVKSGDVLLPTGANDEMIGNAITSRDCAEDVDQPKNSPSPPINQENTTRTDPAPADSNHLSHSEPMEDRVPNSQLLHPVVAPITVKEDGPQSSNSWKIDLQSPSLNDCSIGKEVLTDYASPADIQSDCVVDEREKKREAEKEENESQSKRIKGRNGGRARRGGRRSPVVAPKDEALSTGSVTISLTSATTAATAVLANSRKGRSCKERDLEVLPPPSTSVLTDTTPVISALTAVAAAAATATAELPSEQPQAVGTQPKRKRTTRSSGGCEIYEALPPVKRRKPKS